MSRDSDTNYAGAIYGTIVSMAVIATSAKDPSLGPVLIAFWAAVTALIFWLAHVYADIVAEGYARFRDAGQVARHALRREWPLVQGAMIPSVAMLLTVVTPINTDTATWVAMGAGMVMLFATGLLIGARDQMSWSRRIFVGCVNASFGLVIVGLKVWVH
ncbi:MAG TPA: hypothetical protein PKA56_04835 [Solirubrobacterales bacterium]|nr:hypothetical protein [Solirubrobacterales bacterium]HMW45044.1 hypothetical protein [Solirubrobacterales bacterium]HMX71059.1 hypothetical protein [Solirubrobacterales bacterium]HMY24719.1 hypothetical protein [Solirubrobacterales bacterium]HNA23009.1 hypothetical protein [Solirubrobacterales bacterium]